MERIARGLTWISAILKKHNIPFQITGGLAAHAYGATRPLNDIDIDIPEDRFQEIIPEVEPYIIEGPERFKNSVWDIYVITLNYHGQEIDIGGAYTTRIRDEKTHVWHDLKADLATAETRNIFGIEVPVVNRQDLIEYKSWLALPNDHQERDVREIQPTTLPINTPD